MKKLLAILLLSLISITSFPQIQNSNGDKNKTTTMFDIRRNSIYSEDLLIYAYERILPIDEKFGVTLKGGVFIFDHVMPIVEGGIIIGGTKHFFEVGFGGIPDSGGGFVTVRANYRYQAPKGFLVKAGVIGLVNNLYLPLISIGYAF